MHITFPTFLTIIRLFLTPFIIYAMIKRFWIAALLLFAISALTDVLDGYLARKWQQETKLGAYLDPLADKILVTACYAVFVFAPVEGLVIPTWFFAIVFAKEVVLLGGAVYWGILRKEIEVRPSLLGKSAMALQSALIAWVILCSIFHWAPIKTFHAVLAAALALILGALVQYSYSVWQEREHHG